MQSSEGVTQAPAAGLGSRSAQAGHKMAGVRSNFHRGLVFFSSPTPGYDVPKEEADPTETLNFNHEDLLPRCPPVTALANHRRGRPDWRRH